MVSTDSGAHKQKNETKLIECRKELDELAEKESIAIEALKELTSKYVHLYGTV